MPIAAGVTERTRSARSPLTPRAAARCFLVVLAIVAAPLVVFHPITLSGYTLSQSQLAPAIEPRSGDAKSLPVVDPAATAFQDEPWLAFIAENLARGEITLVDMKNGLGAPFLEALQPGALYVLNPLLLLLDTHGPAFFDTFVLLHVVILIGGLYRLFRMYSRISIALAMAVMVGLSGVTFEHLTMVNYRGFVWLPWMLEATVRIARSRASRGVHVQLVLAALASMTAGNAQDFLFSLGTVIAGFAIECWAWRKSTLPVTRRVTALMTCLAVAMMIGAPAVVPYIVARGDLDIVTAVDAERSVTGLHPDWLLPLLVPKLFGIYPDMLRAEPYTSWVSGFTTVGAFFVLAACIIAASREARATCGSEPLNAREAEECVPPVRVAAMIGWLGFLAIALLKIHHVFVFDFVRWIPVVREVLFPKYHHFIFMPLGIAGCMALEVFVRADPPLRRMLLRRTCAVGAAICVLVAAHIYSSPDWSIPDGLDQVAVRKLTITHATSFSVLAAGILLLRVVNERVLWLLLPLFVVQAALLRPDGYARRWARYYRMPEASDAARLTELHAAPITAANWDRGVSTRGDKAGFAVQQASDLRAIHAGTKLRFAGSGVREVELVLDREVWLRGPPLDPTRDGCPHPIEVVSPEDIAPPELAADARILTALQANQNLLTGVESICVFNPILNRRVATLFETWFPTFNPWYDLQFQNQPGGLTHRHLKALRFLGVSAIYGYDVATKEGLTEVRDRVYRVEGALPRLFLLSEDACAKIEAEWRGVPLARSLADVHEAIGERSIPTTVGTRTLSFDVREPLRGRLVANQAFSRAWTFQGREGRLFCGIFPSWSVELDAGATVQQIVYWPRGLTPALWISGTGVFVALGVLVVMKRRIDKLESRIAASDAEVQLPAKQ